MDGQEFRRPEFYIFHAPLSTAQFEYFWYAIYAHYSSTDMVRETAIETAREVCVFQTVVMWNAYVPKKTEESAVRLA